MNAASPVEPAHTDIHGELNDFVYKSAKPDFA